MINGIRTKIWQRIIKDEEHYKKNILKYLIYELLGILLMCITAIFLSLIFDRIILRGLYKAFLSLCGGETNIVKYLSYTAEYSGHRIYYFFVWFFFLENIIYWGKNKVYNFRYLFAVCLLIFFVIGKFSGSSLGFYDSMLVDNTDDYVQSTLLGTPQGIRGDEWATEKPYYFAQKYVDNAYYNNNLMLDGCDMAVSAFAPVKNIVILARPDLWGFLFLPSDYAFSFYWNVRIILLFMASFELGHLITKSKKYGIIWALFICFAPPIQWWLSQVLMIIVWSGEYFIVAFNKFLASRGWKRKIVYCLLSSWLGIIYVMTMYPAVQVPMGYIFAALLIYIIIINWRKKTVKIKELAYGGGVVTLLLCCFMCYYYSMSSEAINTLLNTTYPGKVRSWTKLQWDYELLQLINPFVWLKPLEPVNNCEASQYYSFMPFLVTALCFEIKGIKENCKHIFIGICSLLIVCTFMWQIAYFPYIKFLGKITLLSYSYPVRILFAVGFGFMLILLMLLHYNESKKIKNQIGIKIFASYFLFAAIYSFALRSDLLSEYLSIKYGNLILLFTVIIAALMGFCIILGGAKATNIFIILYISLSFFSTVFINPITYGTDSMFEKATMKKIREINEADPGRWMVSGHSTISNLVTAQGVARVTGTYYYPDKKMMEIIDPDHEFENMWNQYAHIDMRLSADDNIVSQYDFEQGYDLGGTYRILYVNLETAKKLGVKYIFTKYDVPSEYITVGAVEKIYSNDVDGWDIYAIN